ncbi:MAG: LysM peptidoglycan-binding domain-containing protein, partial [Clostridia bacterium]|nr:LysM peptidoglycan-binding domain-containing protein [Clostridia bacterium]
YTDSTFETNYKNAKAAGLKVGFYHYVTATTTAQAQQQATFFASLISGKSPDCMPAMDFESFGSLSKQAVNDIALAFMQTLEEKSGLKAIIYSDSSNAQSVFGSGLSGYPLWVAEWYVSAPGSLGAWKSWAGFQYSDKGSVPGISGAVDMDTFTDAVFLTNNSSSAVPPTATPATAVPTENITTITVQKGDTLTKLAQTYGTTVSSIVSLNGIQNPDLIYVGEQLKVYSIAQPAAKPSTAPTYTIVAGDTLSGIAKRFNVTVNHLVYINHIVNPDLIYAGKMLVVGA